MSRQNPRLGSTCPIHQTLLGQFPIAVGKLTTGEDIAPMLLSSSWLQDPIFDSFARHTAEFRFAQQFDRAGVPAGGTGPIGSCAGRLAADLALYRAPDRRPILRGQRGHFIPWLSKPLAMRRNSRNKRTGEAQGDHVFDFHLGFPSGPELKLPLHIGIRRQRSYLCLGKLS